MEEERLIVGLRARSETFIWSVRLSLADPLIQRVLREDVLLVLIDALLREELAHKLFDSAKEEGC